mgnify:CR=1 FL=1
MERLEYSVVPAELKHVPIVVEIARQDIELLGWVPKAVFAEAVAHDHLMVATDGKKVYGFIEFGGTTKDKWTIYKIATALPARNKGVGKALINALCLKAREHGAGLRLKVTEDNAVAIDFYQRNGFSIMSVEPSKVRNVLVMEKACN